MTESQPTETRGQRSRDHGSILRRFLTRPFFRWAVITYMAFVAVAMVSFLVSSLFSRLESADHIAFERQSDLAGQIQDLVGRLDTLEQLVLQTGPGPIDGNANEKDTVEQTDSTTLSRFGMLEDSVAALHQDLQALRTILNPTDPSDVLTVLRLGDKFELLTNELDAIRTDIDETKRSVDQRIQQNYDSTTTHVDAVTSTIGWMALLLVPVLLNAVRDFLPRRSQNAKEIPAVQDQDSE